jgi:hypothetical protein
MAAAELVFIEMGHRDGDVLLFATGVSEAEVDELDFVVLHHLHLIGDGLGHQKGSWRDDCVERDRKVDAATWTRASIAGERPVASTARVI